MRKFLIILLFLPYAFFCNEKTRLTYDEYIKIIEDNLLEIKVYENENAKAKNQLTKANSIYDINFNSGFNGIGKKTYPDGSSSEIDYSTGFNGNGSLFTTLPSGTKITLGGEHTQMYSWGESSSIDYQKLLRDRVVDEAENDFFTSTWDQIIYIKASQPLLYNWFGFLDRSAGKDARLKLEIQKLKTLENKKAIINYYKKLYFLWFQYNELLKFLEKTINNAAKLVDQTTKKVKSRVSEIDELQRVKYSLAKYEELYKQIGLEYKEIINELNFYIEVDNKYPVIDEFNKFYEKAFEQEIIFIQFQRTQNSKILNLSKENLEYLKKVKINNSLPELNLTGNIDIKFHQYRRDPAGDSNADVEYDSSYGDVDFVAGIELRYPLGNFKARNELKEIKLNLNELLLEYEVTQNNYYKNLNNIMEGIKVTKEIISIKDESLKYLNIQYSIEKVKNRQARLELKTLLDTENQITNEEIEIMKSKAVLILLYFDYLNLTQ